MNETDVREVIVRPFIERIGYKYGTNAHIRTEVQLRYAKTFIGRKKPGRDPDLKGIADYILEIVDCGRWVIEVKSPNEKLTDEVSEQAHTYAFHPEIGAYFYLIVNGLEWKLFETGRPYQAILSWANDQTENMMPVLKNALAPSAFQRRREFLQIDTGKPLADGLGSKLQIKSGFVTYEEHTTDQPIIANALRILSGQRAPITGGSVYRTPEGKIEVLVSMRSMNSRTDIFSGKPGFGDTIFATTSEFISTDINRPTIFTNFVSMKFEKGQLFGGFMGLPDYPAPFEIQMAAFSQAVAYIDNDICRGTHEISYLMEVGASNSFDPSLLMMSEMIHNLRLTGRGDFEIYF